MRKRGNTVQAAISLLHPPNSRRPRSKTPPGEADPKAWRSNWLPPRQPPSPRIPVGEVPTRRATHRDLGLVFAKENPDLLHQADALGTPIRTHNIGSGEFARLIKTADVKRITFHGLRHTSATLMLLAGEPAKVVSERLGHAKIGTTLATYSHVLPTMQRQAADRLGALLHG